jgi:hypothetical protein
MVFGEKFHRFERNERTVLHTAQTGKVFGPEVLGFSIAQLERCEFAPSASLMTYPSGDLVGAPGGRKRHGSTRFDGLVAPYTVTVRTQ